MEEPNGFLLDFSWFTVSENEHLHSFLKPRRNELVQLEVLGATSVFDFNGDLASIAQPGRSRTMQEAKHVAEGRVVPIAIGPIMTMPIVDSMCNTNMTRPVSTIR